jgi:hypothetical protein
MHIHLAFLITALAFTSAQDLFDDKIDDPIENTSSSDFISRGGFAPPPTTIYSPLGGKCGSGIALPCQPNAVCRFPTTPPAPNATGFCRLLYRQFGEQCGGKVDFPFVCKRGLYCQRNRDEPRSEGRCVYPPATATKTVVEQPTEIIVIPVTTVKTVIVTQTQETVTQTVGGTTTTVVVPSSIITNVIPTILESTKTAGPTTTAKSGSSRVGSGMGVLLVALSLFT